MENEKDEVRFEPLPKPELTGSIEVRPNTEEFSDPEKAEALIRLLELKAGDKIEENGDYFEINPRYELRGTPPEDYKKDIKYLKVLLTKKEKELISKAIKSRAKNYDEKLYKKITKRLEKLEKGKTEEIQRALEHFSEQKHTGINNTIYHLLSKGSDKWLICYKCAWKEQPIPDQRTWDKKIDGEYRVLTDGEADDAVEDYYDESFWREEVRGERTSLGYQDWIEEQKNNDRGETLNGYNGSEEEVEVNGTAYFIYRNN